MSPTISPTQSPSNNPTNNPTLNPTKSPSTSKPTKSPIHPYFGPGGISVGGVLHLDLFILIDLSGSMDDNNLECRNIKTISGIKPKTCLDLTFDTIIELINKLDEIIGMNTNILNEGLRVMIKGFSCEKG